MTGPVLLAVSEESAAVSNTHVVVQTARVPEPECLERTSPHPTLVEPLQPPSGAHRQDSHNPDETPASSRNSDAFATEHGGITDKNIAHEIDQLLESIQALDNVLAELAAMKKKSIALQEENTELKLVVLRLSEILAELCHDRSST